MVLRVARSRHELTQPATSTLLSAAAMPKRYRPPPASTSGARPERQAPAESFYSASEAAQYDSNPRMAATQRHLADRALQLLALPAGAPALLLDVGCGTGYSGDTCSK